MQLASCELFPATAAALRPRAAAARSGRRRPSITTTVAPAAMTVTKKKPASAAMRCHCSSRSRRDDDDDTEEFNCSSGGGGGRLVDEEMLVLRRRIHAMRAAERTRNWEPPEEWAAWEKEWYATYDADVCDLLCALQAFLLNSRPGVGVGILAALALAVPACAFVLVTHILDASRAINLHH